VRQSLEDRPLSRNSSGVLAAVPDRHPFIRKLAVELPIAGAPIGIITLKNRTPSPVVQRFIDSSREVAKPLTRRR
jgi:hypothetical protein